MRLRTWAQGPWPPTSYPTFPRTGAPVEPLRAPPQAAAMGISKRSRPSAPLAMQCASASPVLSSTGPTEVALMALHACSATCATPTRRNGGGGSGWTASGSGSRSATQPPRHRRDTSGTRPCDLRPAVARLHQTCTRRVISSRWGSRIELHPRRAIALVILRPPFLPGQWSERSVGAFDSCNSRHAPAFDSAEFTLRAVAGRSHIVDLAVAPRGRHRAPDQGMRTSRDSRARDMS